MTIIASAASKTKERFSDAATVSAGSTAISVKMLRVGEVDLNAITTAQGGTPDFTVLNVSGTGDARITADGKLRYQSQVETGQQTVNYRATVGGVTSDGVITVTLTDTFSVAEVDAKVVHDTANLAAGSATTFTDSDGPYQASYVSLGLRNMFQGTGNPYYFNQFKVHVDGAIASAVHNIARVPGTVASPFGGPSTGGPYQGYGASHATYEMWGTEGTPNQKACDQWAMTTQLFIYDILTETGECANLSAADRTWARTAYDFISKNVRERLRSNYGSQGSLPWQHHHSAHKRIFKYPGKTWQWGYWGSQAGTQACHDCIDEAIRDFLGLPEYNFHDVSRQRAVLHDWQTTYGFGYTTHLDWWEWWKSHITFEPDGRCHWDIGNPNLQRGNGWGSYGDHQAPDVSHASRYWFWAWLKSYLGQDKVNADKICAGLDKQWADVCVLPLDYVTPDGNHQGEIAGTFQIATYIDGVDTIYRGGRNAANSTAGSGGHSFYHQLGYFYPKSREKLADMYDLAAGPWRSTSDKRHTGTWSRHWGGRNVNDVTASKNYGAFCAFGNLLDAMKRPLGSID